MAPQVGLEPTTLRLTAECSTIELLRSNELTSLEQTDWQVSNLGAARALQRRKQCSTFAAE